MRVALTFDAEHPDHPSDPVANLYSILDILGDIEATFFVQGRWASAYPETVKAIRDAGHLIGSHSHYHAPMTTLTEAGLNMDITSAETAIRAAAKVDPRPWFRPPFGKTDNRVEFFLNKWGYKSVGWTLNSEDYKGSYEGSRERLKVLSDGDVVLMHTWPDVTPRLLEGVLSAGVDFVRLDA